MVTIARSSVIAGAEQDTYYVGGKAGDVSLSSTITLDATAVQGLTTALELLPAPPAGKAHVVLGVYSTKAAAAFSDGAVVNVQYADASTTAIGSFPLAHYTGGAASTWMTRAALTGAPAAQVLPSAAVQMVTGTAFTGNGGNVDIVVRSVLVDI